jgi:hypothetical protein
MKKLMAVFLLVGMASLAEAAFIPASNMTMGFVGATGSTVTPSYQGVISSVPVAIQGTSNAQVVTSTLQVSGSMQVVSSTVQVQIGAALPTGANTIGTTNVGTLPTLTKGTQGTTGVSVQALEDAGRTHVNYYATAVAAGATGVETILTLTKASGTSATATATTEVPASGKTFRITSITFASRGNATATAQVTTFNFRINTGGACVVTSTPITFSARTATAAVASDWDRFQLPLPDGYEIAGNGTLNFCITANSTFVTNAPTWDVMVTGFEY